MSTLETATTALRELEALLPTTPLGALDQIALAEQVRAVHQLLAGEDALWIGTTTYSSTARRSSRSRSS